MPVSHLTTPASTMFTSMVAALTDYTYSPLTQTRAQYLATVASGLTGGSYSHLTTSEDQLLALVGTELSGTIASQLTLSEEQLLALICNNPPEEGETVLEVINEANNTEITEADYPTLTAVTTFIDFSGCDNLATASFPVLETVGGDIFFDRGALQTIDFSSLISVGGYLRLAGSEGLTVVSFPALTTVAFDINFDFTFSLTEASFPSLLSLGG